MYRRLRTPSPLRDVREPSPTPALRRSSCLRRPPTCTGNVYGELRDPTDIEQEISHEAQWEHYTSGASSPEDAPPLQLPEDTPSDSPRAATPLEYADPEQGEEEETSPSGSTELSNGTNSSESVEEILFHWQGLNFLVKEGGVHYLNYLLAKADTPNLELPDVSKVREWSYKDLLRLPKSQQKEWMGACYQELDSLCKHDVYDLVIPPPERRIICNCWVFDRKTDGWKQACLVAKGFSQIEGIDYDDIFSPVVRYELVRLIVALAALQHWHMSSVDVKTAFLYGELDEELFMEQPEGFKKKGHEHKVFHLKWALYKLKQAALQWWWALDKSMKAMGFKYLKSDSGVFVLMHSGWPEVIVIVYVDNAVFLGRQKHLVNNYKQCFMCTWECCNLGETKEFLKMRITHLKGVITLDQKDYLMTVLKCFNMYNVKEAFTPLPLGYNPVPNKSPVDKKLHTRYQRVIGSLLYLMLGTWPDITYAVTKMAQFAANPSEEHLTKALYICKYLAGTIDYSLQYGLKQQGLYAYADAD
jgi:Reverse transcriptase (RNA-dependent DNA polymerase)